MEVVDKNVSTNQEPLHVHVMMVIELLLINESALISMSAKRGQPNVPKNV
jgi:hypothetical protein